jgi:1-acyl-sn-glycerol-3-phosphate acyltransferase
VEFSLLQEKPCLLLCNHPTFDDPIVLLLFSAYLRQPFYYMAAYEQFLGWKGWFLQQVGAYSVQRGLSDRDSIAQTLELLTQPDCKLVLFPEGGCSFQNDTVMPFRPGAVQIGLQAIARCVKRGQPVPDLHVVPLSLKYYYTGRMTPVIDRTLSTLEQALGVASNGDLYQRLRTVAQRILSQFEQDYDLVAETTDWNQRILTLKDKVLRHCEQVLGLTVAPHEPNRERVYRIRRAIDRQQSAAQPGENQPDWQTMSRAMMRVLNFDATYDGYVAEKPTPERFLDILVRFEREVFGIDQPRPKAHRQAFLRIGQPVRLSDHFESYQHDRASTVSTLIEQIQQTVQRNLDILSDATARGISW